MPRKPVEMLTFNELAERLRVSQRTLFRWKRHGIVVPYGPRRLHRYKWDDILDTIRRSTPAQNAS